MELVMIQLTDTDLSKIGRRAPRDDKKRRGLRDGAEPYPGIIAAHPIFGLSRHLCLFLRLPLDTSNGGSIFVPPSFGAWVS
eukprot:scaffold70598_cov60-Attheya_sp.AAC.2